MKKTILKVLLWITKIAGSIGISYLFGAIAGWLVGKLVDEEFAENHPYISIFLFILATVVVTAASMLIITYPLEWIFVWLFKKVDDIEDDPEWES